MARWVTRDFRSAYNQKIDSSLPKDVIGSEYPYSPQTVKLSINIDRASFIEWKEGINGINVSIIHIGHTSYILPEKCTPKLF